MPGDRALPDARNSAVGFEFQKQVVAISNRMFARGQRPDRQLPAGGEKGKALEQIAPAERRGKWHAENSIRFRGPGR